MHIPAPSADEEIGSARSRPGDPSENRRTGRAPGRDYPRPALRPQQRHATLPPSRPQLASGSQELAAGKLQPGRREPSSSERQVGPSTRGTGSAAGGKSVPGEGPAPAAPPAAEAPPAAAPAPTLTPPILLNPSAAYPSDGYALAVDRSLVTPELRLLASEGRVVVRLFVRADGTVGTITITQSSGNPALDGAAVEAASSWGFQPATRDGVAIDAWVVIPVRFVLP